MIKHTRTLLAAIAVTGVATASCSGEHSANNPDELGTVQGQLRVDNDGLSVEGTTTEIDYELNCGGDIVKDGTIPVPLDGSTISGHFGSVQPAEDCKITLSTTVQLDTDLNPDPAVTEDSVECSAMTDLFDVGPGELIDVGEIVVTCSIDQTSDITFSGFIELVDQSLDSYFVGPLLIEVNPLLPVPPITLMIAQPLQDGVDYAWSVNPPTGGTFDGCDTTPEACEFFCAADGTHTLSLTANFGDTTLTRDVDVTCVTGVVCGDGNPEGAEECDDGNTTSGDGCNSLCQLEFCGDGQTNNAPGGVATEECDDGNTNDDDACGNDCLLPVCGDDELEGDEDCESTGGVFPPGCDPVGCFEIGFCGDGIPGNSPNEECDDGVNDGTACNSDCTLPVLNPLCEDCLDTNVPGGLNQACTADANCAEVRDCVVDSNCFQTGGSPSVCYCGVGVNINDCVSPTFVPTGACVDEIVDAFIADGLPTDNATVAGQMAAATTTSGQAFGILIPATNFGICIAECSL